MSIEENFTIPFVSSLALKEKQIQQNYRPIISVHKWFARRPGTLFRSLILSEFRSQPLEEIYFRANEFPGLKIADPFMGGGIPLIEANRVGCDVLGFDINPMATWIVKEEIEHINLQVYRQISDELVDYLTDEVGAAYRTDCPHYGDREVPVKYFLWVKTIACFKCGEEIDLFPGYMIAENTRHPHYVLLCSVCFELNEIDDPACPGKCRACASTLSVEGPAHRNHCLCPKCGNINEYPRAERGVPRHRMFAIEYSNPNRLNHPHGRFFKKPDAKDLDRYQAFTERWRRTVPEYVPDQKILPGDETDRLHRWGYQYYRDLFNERQLLGLELSCRWIASVEDTRIRHALATNLSDLLRYQNMLCRYDVMALKSLDIFSIHGFPVGLVQCESNLIGVSGQNGVKIGSGGWTNIIEKYYKAKRYCFAPFEVMFQGSRKTIVPIPGEWIGERLDGARTRSVTIRCASSTTLDLQPGSLDAVFTDPPYFGNVQYGELMDFCYVWLRRLVGQDAEGFDRSSSRSHEELTGNVTEERGLEQFTEGLSKVFYKMAQALKPGAPLAFTYHHNRLDAYHAIGVAILDAGLFCSATFPCPAEMSGSIHIHGTGSSIVDTVFVCRTDGVYRADQYFDNLEMLSQIVHRELMQLLDAGVKATKGDIRCILYGHLTQMAIYRLQDEWNPALPAHDRLQSFANAISAFGNPSTCIDALLADVHEVKPDKPDEAPFLFEQG